MNITFLGTSSGMPTRQRNVTAIALAPANSKRWYLIDCGEATQHQLLHTHLALQRLQAIMITHVHGDHCYGLPGLLASAATNGRTETLSIIAPAAIKDYVEAVCLHTTLKLPYPLNFYAVETLETPFISPDYEITRIAMSHRVPSFAYEFNQKPTPGRLNTEKLHNSGIPQGPLWGHIQNGEDVRLHNGKLLHAQDYLLPVKARRVIIGGDNDDPKLLTERAAGADVLVHEATYTAAVAQEVGPGPGHSSAASVAKFAQDTQIPNLILTHFSKRYHQSSRTSISEVRDEAKRYYKGTLYLANDFDVYELQSNGVIRLSNSRT